MNQVENRLLTVTPTTIVRIQEMFKSDPQSQGKALRVMVGSGSCSSYQYNFAFDSKKENDTELTFDGFSILVDPQSVPILKGCVVDYKDDFGNSGFSIKNPNVKSSCGCGQSFELK